MVTVLLVLGGWIATDALEARLIGRQGVDGVARILARSHWATPLMGGPGLHAVRFAPRMPPPPTATDLATLSDPAWEGELLQACVQIITLLGADPIALALATERVRHVGRVAAAVRRHRCGPHRDAAPRISCSKTST